MLQPEVVPHLVRDRTHAEVPVDECLGRIAAYVRGAGEWTGGDRRKDSDVMSVRRQINPRSNRGRLGIVPNPSCVAVRIVQGKNVPSDDSGRQPGLLVGVLHKEAADRAKDVADLIERPRPVGRVVLEIDKHDQRLLLPESVHTGDCRTRTTYRTRAAGAAEI